ncbi:MAG: vWA domain-containing protein, partial [Actinomycetota bacterium]
AAQTTLASRPEDMALLNEAFDRYFGSGEIEQIPDGSPHTATKPPWHRDKEIAPGTNIVSAARWSPDEGREETEGEAAIRIVASEVERLQKKDFAELSEDERRAALVRIRRLALVAPARPSRRYRQAREGERFDLRQTLRRSLRTEGEPFQRAWKKRQRRRRPLVLILDVSGSMAPYSRPLLEFAHASANAGRRVEVFCFGTRLTRITRALKTRDPQHALATVGTTVSDWEGGTRIGDSLKELLDRWSSRTALRGSVVVLCSDGLERGDPAVLAAQMTRLSRLAHRVLWLNPLKGSPRYEPLARGMAASLPFVDVFLPGHNLESLEALAGALALA